ncbi:unnamed protein product [Rotaria sp. Silwood1]|nr:unnamed protein product [Rotaria sp. Silwood1]CAF4621924.1 unnamed protein product [Rotaria sp. Silwood1]
MSYVVTAATGQVGSAVVNYLLSQSVSVRAVIRSESRSEYFTSRNIEVAIADLTNADALTKAFQGAKAVFAMNPPVYETSDMNTAAMKVSNALAAAIQAAQVPRVVILSSVGAEKSSGTGNILTTHILEETLKGTAPQIVIIRCAWFMENWFKSVSAVKLGQSPVLGSMLQKLERKIPQVATDDIGRVAAEYMTKPAQAVDRMIIVELEGPEPYSPNDVAQIVSKALGKNIHAAAMTEEMIRGLFGKVGWPKETVDNWIEMVQGFDNDTICWTTNGNVTREKGTRTLDEVLGKVLSEK